MAVDTSIYQPQPGTLGNIGQSYLAGQQMRAQQQAQEQQRQIRDLELKAGQRDFNAKAALDQAYADAIGPDGKLDKTKLLSRVPGHLVPSTLKFLDDAEKSTLDLQTARTTLEGHQADLLGAMGAAVREGGYDFDLFVKAVRHALDTGLLDQETAQSYVEAANSNPAVVKQITDSAIAASPKYAQLAATAAVHAETGRHNIATEKTAAAGVQATAANREADNTRQAGTAAETARHNRAMEARPVAGAVPSDAADVAAAIIDGSQPPDTTGLGPRFVGPVRAELARKGYDFTKANLDWQAVKKHVASMNGAQQLRLRQAAETAYHSLDVIDELGDKWKGGRFPLLNAGSLKIAKAGAFGKDAQSIATQLEAQISDLTSELGNVYMGGNSPTDHALQLAGKNLSAQWSNDVLRDMTKLARTNLKIRLNSMNSIGAAGLSTPADQEMVPVTPAATGGPVEGATKEIPGFPGTEQTLRNGKWIRTK